MDSNNPYASPEPAPSPLGPPCSQLSGWARHVRIVARLLVLQGVLELGPAGMAWLLLLKKKPDAQLLILPMLFLPVLKIVAGRRNGHFRDRAIGIVALATAPLFGPMFICFPTAVLLAIYGLFVYFTDDAKHAFATYVEDEETLSVEKETVVVEQRTQEVCPWCDELVMADDDDRCPACHRPI